MRAGASFRDNNWHKALRRLALASLVAAGITLPALSQQLPDRPAAANNAMPGWQRHFLAAQDGAPSYVHSIVQTPDGFLWFSAADGVYRYDGIRFERIPPSTSKPVQSISILSLLAMPNGDLWIGHDWGGISLYRNGRHVPLLNPMISTVPILRRNAKGMAWAVANRNANYLLLRLESTGWVQSAAFPKHSYISDAVVSPNGRLWLLEQGQLFFADPGNKRVATVASPPMPDASLLIDGTGAPWLIRRNTIHRLLERGPIEAIGPAIPKAPVASGGRTEADGAGGFWAAEGGNRLANYRFDTKSGATVPVASWQSPYWLPDAGLDSYYLGMLVDRQGSLWVGTSLGIERFTPSAFTTMLRSADGAQGEPASPYVVQDGLGDVWLRKGRELFKVAADGSLARQAIALSPNYTPCGSSTGGLWVPDGRGSLVVFGGPKRAPVPLAGPNLMGVMTDGHCAQDGSGRIWANDRAGLVLLGQGGARHISLGEDDGVPVLNLVPDGNGVLAYIGNGSLWRSDGKRSAAIWKPSSMTLGYIGVMYRTSRYLLLGGDRGLARVIDGRVEMISRERVPELLLTAGITQTAQGDTWLQTIRGLLRIRTDLLERAFQDPKFVPPFRLFDAADGLPGTSPTLNMSSLASDRHGRVWITANNGVARYDPAFSKARQVPLHIVLLGLEADGKRHPPSADIVLPAGTGRLRIDFTAPSSISPEQLRFRYRLSDVDSDWVQTGSERAAIYTSLPPGKHRFEVMVADSEGRWNAPASLNINVQDHFYQRWWFLALCVLALLLASYLFYRWRLGVVSRQLRSRAAERAFERDRIARDLHDTLLQGVQGLVLRFQSVTNGLKRDDPNRDLLADTLDRADQLIAEGRQRVMGLRSDDPPVDLPAILEAALAEAPSHIDVAKSFVIRGKHTDVIGGVAHEVREIVGEALFNAARHARAKHIGVEVELGARQLEVLVADDGIGRDAAQRVRTGLPGLGLTGMQERAAQIGASLSIENGPHGGTLVRLRVPARAAYAAPMAGHHRKRAGKGRT